MTTYLLGVLITGLAACLIAMILCYAESRRQLAQAHAALTIEPAGWWDPDVPTVPSRSVGRHCAEDPSRVLVPPSWTPLIGARLQAVPAVQTSPGFMTVADLEAVWRRSLPAGWLAETEPPPVFALAASRG